MFRSIAVAVVILLPLASSAHAEDAILQTGGDYFAAGQNMTIVEPLARDAFLAGANVRLDADVAGDAHLAGFAVDVGQRVTGDLYAAGFTVNVNAAVAGDITAAGSSVVLGTGTSTGGNVRLAGASVTISGPVTGSALISTDTLNLNSAIAGDLNFNGRAINFGPGATIAGAVAIHAPEQIAVPTSVAPASRVSYQRLDVPDYVGEAGRTAGSVASIFWPAFWALLAWSVLLLVVGGLFIALAPRLVSALEMQSADRPFFKFGLGILAFAAMLGLPPLSAITVFGLLLLPFVLLFVAIVCILAYLAGIYVLGMRVGGAFLTLDTNVKRLAVLVVSIVVATGFGIIPLLGWLSILALTTVGFGVISALILDGRRAGIRRDFRGASTASTV